VSAYARSSRRLERYSRSDVALITSTGQSCVVSKFAGTAIVTNAWVTGESLPRPATLRRSIGNSTLNSLNVPAVGAGAATAAIAIPDANNNVKRRIMAGSTPPAKRRRDFT
jgi:hypothetical protein